MVATMTIRFCYLERVVIGLGLRALCTVPKGTTWWLRVPALIEVTTAEDPMYALTCGPPVSSACSASCRLGS